MSAFLGEMTDEERSMFNALPSERRQKLEEVYQFMEDLTSHKVDVPSTCIGCPAHDIDYFYVAADTCLLNTEVYSGDLFFARHKEPPKWCPAKKYRGEVDGENGQQDNRQSF